MAYDTTDDTPSRDAILLELSDLKAWKAQAIAKYPDLNVHPLLLKAREITAEVNRYNGYTELAVDVLAGVHDANIEVQIAYAALRSVQGD